jgi:hypothetical protein
MITAYIVIGAVNAVVSLYFAWRYREFRKFLAGAFFVSSGVLFYLYLADVSVPLLGTNFVETPVVSGTRSIVHFVLFLLCCYFGWINKPNV